MAQKKKREQKLLNKLAKKNLQAGTAEEQVPTA